MKGILGLIITLLVLLSPPYPLHAQSLRAGGFAARGISGGMRGARIGATGSGGHVAISNFRGGLSRVGSSSSFRGNSVGMGNRMVNSNLPRRGFGQNISNIGASFGSSSNLPTSTLGKNMSNPQFQLISVSRKNTIASINSRSTGFDSGRLKKVESRFRTETSLKKVGRTHTSSNNISNTSTAVNHPLIIDNKASLSTKTLNSNRNGNLKHRLTGIAGRIKPVDKTSIVSAGNTDIVHWLDRKNGSKNFSNNINSIPKEAKTITLVDGKMPRTASALSDRTRNLRDSRSDLGEAPAASTDNTAELVMKKTVNIPGQRRGLDIERDDPRRNFHKANHTKGFHHDNGFTKFDHRHLHHHYFHHNHFFPFNPFFFSNSFFFFRPFFPLSTFFFVDNPFILQPIFPSPFFVFNPFIFLPVPIVLFPVFPQFISFTPFINPFFASPFFNPFFFGTDFFFNSIAFDNFF